MSNSTSDSAAVPSGERSLPRSAPVWKFTGISSHALWYRPPRYGEPWLEYIQGRNQFLVSAREKLTSVQRHALNSRENDGKRWIINKNNRTVIYELDCDGRIVKLECCAKSSIDIHRMHAPWDRRFIPELAQWDICIAYHCPPEVRMDKATLTRIAIPEVLSQAELQDYLDHLEENDAYHHGLDVAFHPLEDSFWDIYKQKYDPSMRPDDLTSIRPKEPIVFRSPPSTPPYSPDHPPIPMDVDDNAPLPLPPVPFALDTPPPSPPPVQRPASPPPPPPTVVSSTTSQSRLAGSLFIPNCLSVLQAEGGDPEEGEWDQSLGATSSIAFASSQTQGSLPPGMRTVHRCSYLDSR